MRPLSRSSLRQSRSTLVVALLLATVLVTAVLTREAHVAAQSHRATTERAVRDYASFAAWELTVHGKEDMYAALRGVFAPIWDIQRRSFGRSALPKPTVLEEAAAKAEECDCMPVAPARMYFRLDLADHVLSTAGPLNASGELRSWIADTVAAHARLEYDREWWFALIFAKAGGEPHAVAYTLKRNVFGTPVAAYGIEMDPGDLGRALFGKIVRHWPLLPPALTDGAENDSLLTINVAANGIALFRSHSAPAAPFSGEAKMRPYFGGITAEVALRPSAIDKLFIGGLPRSRLPLLAGLLALTAGLVVVAVWQLRREQELARLRAGFVSSVSHELRTPLAQIRMFSETLRLGRVRSEVERERSLEIIDQEARRLTHLVDNVLQFSRAERRTINLVPEPTVLADHVHETVDSFLPLARSRKTTIHVEPGQRLVVSVDRYALRQMLLNLLDNAVKYGPPAGAISVRLSYTGTCARICVDDQGPGIPSREREWIFAPFHRLERDANSAVAGSGLGLAVVRELAVLHGGRAWVEDAPGGGARFVIDLPVGTLGQSGDGRAPAEPERQPLVEAATP